LIGALTELYQALVCVIEENRLPGVLEVLLTRFKMVEGNINLERKRGKMVKRVQGRKEQVERGRLLYLAAENCRGSLYL